MQLKIIDVLFSCAFALFCLPAKAAHPLVTDDTGTQGTGNHQLEANTDWSHHAGASSGVAALTYTYGKTPNIDVYANLPLNATKPKGVGDTSLGLKWRAWENGTSSVALKPEILLPSGNAHHGLGNGRVGGALALLATNQYELWSFHANFAVQMNRYSDPELQVAYRSAIWRASVATICKMSEKAAFVADVGNAQQAERALQSRATFALLGLIYSINSHVDVDLGLKRECDAGDCTRQVGGGITVRF